MEKDNSDKEYLADTEKSFSDSEKEISVSEGINKFTQLILMW